MASYKKEIRDIKRQGRPSLSRPSLDANDPSRRLEEGTLTLLPRVAVENNAHPSAATAAPSSSTGTTPRSPFESQRTSFAGPYAAATLGGSTTSTSAQRDGRQLWGLVKSHLRQVREMEEMTAEELQADTNVHMEKPRQSIVEKFMFSLNRSPTFYDDRLHPSTSGLESIHESLDPVSGGGGSTLPLLLPPNVPKPVPGFWSPRSDAHYMWHMIMGSFLNVLLLAIPIGIVSGALHYSPSLVFWSNFMALLPLALILGEITEDLAVRFGDTIGGLLNASFGNVVEMILGLAALSKGLYKVVAASLIGSILSNLLLVLGCCFLFGGFRHKHQRFNTLANKVSSSLLFLSCISIMIPTTAKSVYGDQVMSRDALVSLSHAIAIMLVGMYICYLFFQLKTHADSLHGSPSMFLLPKGISIPPDVSETDFIGYLAAAVAAQNTGSDDGSGGAAQQEQQSSLVTNITTSNSNGNLIPNGGGNEVEEVQVDDVTTGGQIKEEEEQEHEEEEGGDDDEGQEHVPRLSLSCAIFSLSIITILVAICSEFLTGAIEAVSASSGINEAFLGLIVLPIAGNAAEHITAVFVAVKNKMDLAISVALGSSIQIAIFVLPVTVLAGWAMGKELTLDFDPFAVLMMTVSVILAYFVSSDGSSNWLLGLQLVVTYVLIGSVYLLEKESAGPDTITTTIGMNNCSL